MEIFKRRPLALASFLFLLSLAVSFYMKASVKKVFILLSVFVLAFSIVVFIFSKKNRNNMVALILSALFAAAAFCSSYGYFDLNYNKLQKYANMSGKIEATVTNVIYRSNYASYLEIKVSCINGERENTKMKLECAYDCPLETGDFFIADVRFAELKDERNGYPEKMIGISKGQSLTAVSDSADGIYGVEHGRFDLMIFASKLNARLGGILSDVIGKESSGLSRAILLGNKGALSVFEERDIRYVGISHLLALSGMHLTILIGNIGYLFTLIRVPKKVRLPILAVLTAAYVVLTGMQLSMVRSAIMLFVAYFAFLVGRERDMLTSLFFSVMLICFVMPYAFFDIGLQLSFLSMVGIVVFQDVFKDLFEHLFENVKPAFWGGGLNYICMSISITFVASVSVLPAVWLYFGETSLIAVLGNLILSSFADLILMLSPFVIIFCKIPFAGPGVGWLVGRLSDMMLDICAELAKNRGVMISLRYPFAGCIILLTALVLAVMLIVRIEKKRSFLVPVVLGASVFSLCLVLYTHIHAGELDITHISDGHNEGFVVVSEGRALVCDISSGSHSFAQSLIYERHKLAVCDIEVYLLTHYHERHIETFDKISDEVYIRNIWMPSPADKEEALVASALREIASEKDIGVFVYDAKSFNELDFESIEIDIMPRAFIHRSNHPIIALSFENDSARLAYIGSSVHESTLYKTVLPLVSDSETVVFGSHGAKIKSAFSYGALSRELDSVLFADANVFEFADLSDTDFAASLERADVSVGEKISRLVFD